MLIDTHCHLDVSDFDLDRDRVLAEARRRGVGPIVVPAIHAAGWPGLLALCRRESGLYPALGLHPVFLDQHRPGDLEELAGLIAREGPVAVGEIGLDFFLLALDRERQRALFTRQLDLAAAARLPVLIHARKAHDEVLACLRRHPVPGGIIHAFNGSLQQAQQYLAMGFKLGFGGMLTFAQSSRLRALATALPLDALVLETDAPDMSGSAHRGERNSPAYLPEVLQVLAQVRGQEAAYLAEQTSHNAREVLDLTRWPRRDMGFAHHDEGN